jgi:hypothetical protein
MEGRCGQRGHSRSSRISDWSLPPLAGCQTSEACGCAVRTTRREFPPDRRSVSGVQIELTVIDAMPPHRYGRARGHVPRQRRCCCGNRKQ